MSNANLSDADLSAAIFDGADLTATVVTGAIGNSMITRMSAISVQFEANQGELAANQSELAAAQLQLINEFTLTEIVDLRPGSTMIEIIDGYASLCMTLEESTDQIK